MATKPQLGSVKIPTLEPIPYVVVKLATGQTVLRHPDEVKAKK
jgi:hypothetical protein